VRCVSDSVSTHYYPLYGALIVHSATTVWFVMIKTGSSGTAASKEEVELEKQRIKIEEMKEAIELIRMESYNEVFMTALRREQVLQSIVEILDKIHDHPIVNHALVRTGIRQIMTLAKELKEVTLKCVFRIVNWTLEEAKLQEEEAQTSGGDDNGDKARPPPKFMFLNDPSNDGSAGSRAATANNADAVEYLVKMYTDLNPVVVKLRFLCESKRLKQEATKEESDSDSSSSSEEEDRTTSIWLAREAHKTSRVANSLSKTALQGVFNLHDPLFIQTTFHLENFSGKRSLYAAALVILDAVQRDNARLEAERDDAYYSEDEFEKISPTGTAARFHVLEMSPPRSASELANEETKNRKRIAAIGRESGLQTTALSGHMRVLPGGRIKPLAAKPEVAAEAAPVVLTGEEAEQCRSEEHAKLIGANGSNTPVGKLKRQDNRRASVKEVNRKINAIMSQLSESPPQPVQLRPSNQIGAHSVVASSYLSGENAAHRSSPSLPFSVANSSNIHVRSHGGFANAIVDPKTGVSYRKCKVLGQGAFAKVFEVMRDSDMKEVACKIFENPGPEDDDATSEYMLKCMEREIRLLGLIQTNAALGKQGDQSASVFSIRSAEDEGRIPAVGSKSVVSMLDHFVLPGQHPRDQPVTHMIMEKMQYTLLNVPVDRTTKGMFNGAAPIEMLVKSVMQQILAALAYIHSLGIIHRCAKSRPTMFLCDTHVYLLCLGVFLCL
jgi:hypothetical protein